MFGEKTMQSSAVTGLASYTLDGAVGAFNAWRSQFPDGSIVFYYAERVDASIWEAGWGTLAYGAPDTLSRNVVISSQGIGSKISWVPADAPIMVFSNPSATAMAAMLKGGLGAVRPVWAQAAFGWLDDTLGLAVTWVKKRWTGTVDIEEGRFDIANAIYTPSPRNTWVDHGAAGLTVLPAHVGQVHQFDTTAAPRAVALPAGATAGIGHGFTCWVLGYGGTTNGVVLTPNGAEKIDAGAGGGTLTIPPNQLTRLAWDGAKLQWRTDTASAVVGVKAVREQVFPASATYTADLNLLYAKIECWAGAGGGGAVASAAGNQGAGGGGGQAGGRSAVVVPAASIGVSKPVVIGAGGAGGAAGNNAGANGTDTTVGTLCVAKGGAGGAGNAGAAYGGASGGAATAVGTGTVSAPGAPGGTSGNGNLCAALGGAGGSSDLGAGGAAVTTATTLAGNPGTGYAAGGSGGACYSGAAAAAGGLGTGGYTLITEYCSA